MRRRLCASLRWIDRACPAVNDEVIDPVFHERRRVRDLPKPLEVALVLGEEQRVRVLAIEPVIAEHMMARRDAIRAGSTGAKVCGSSRPQLQVLRNQSVGNT